MTKGITKLIRLYCRINFGEEWYLEEKSARKGIAREAIDRGWKAPVTDLPTETSFDEVGMATDSFDTFDREYSSDSSSVSSSSSSEAESTSSSGSSELGGEEEEGSDSTDEKESPESACGVLVATVLAAVLIGVLFEPFIKEQWSKVDFCV